MPTTRFQNTRNIYGPVAVAVASSPPGLDALEQALGNLLTRWKRMQEPTLVELGEAAYMVESLRRYHSGRRGTSLPEGEAEGAFCKNGHPRDEINTYVSPQGARNCRVCQRRAAQARYRKKVA